MIGERELSGVALPFAAGVLSASLLSTLPYHIINAIALPSGAVSAACTYMMSRKVNKQNMLWIWVIITTFITGAFCFCNAAILQTTSISNEGFITGLATGLCDKVQAAIDNLPFKTEETSAIMKALITGERSTIPNDVKEAFRASGASHILALSGLHLGIIYGITLKILVLPGNTHRAVIGRSIAAVTICGFYTIATGAGESIVRAFLFILLNETAKLTHRRHDLKQILLAALMIQLTISPLSIRSAGFQLSYAAMAGIAFINPWLQNFWPRGKSRTNIPRKIWESASVSISCQLTTGPFAWYYFGSLPTNFLLTNLIAMPLVGLIIPASILIITLSGLGICPNLLIMFTEQLITIMTSSLKAIAEI